MIPIPQDLSTLYNSLLIQKAVPEMHHPYYRKWLRYYLDFCQKYGFRQSDTKSLTPFINKLREKKQTNRQQKQAVDAISLYYGYHSTQNGKMNVFKIKEKTISRKKEDFKETNASWVPAYNDLYAEIKLRHYSKSTLRTYTTWTRQFQGFTKSKDPGLLSPSDVKEFLTGLAVVFPGQKADIRSQYTRIPALSFA